MHHQTCGQHQGGQGHQGAVKAGHCRTPLIFKEISNCGALLPLSVSRNRASKPCAKGS
jgi:hypothetical protein